MKRSKGFTLIELLVVVAIIALLISILLPSLSKARELAKRSVCGASLKGNGNAIAIYANQYRGSFPLSTKSRFRPSTKPALLPDKYNESNTISSISMFDSTRAPNLSSFHRWQRVVVKASTPATTLDIVFANKDASLASPSRDIFLLVKQSIAQPGQFVCPSTGHTEDPLWADKGGPNHPGDPAVMGAGGTTAVPAAQLWDFLEPDNLDYGYMFAHDQDGELANEGIDPQHPVMADSNPYVREALNGGVMQVAGYGGSKAVNNERTGDNSPNHLTEGQNVLYGDFHVSFFDRPTVGVGGDNIYTFGFSRANGTDPKRDFGYALRADASTIGQGDVPGNYELDIVSKTDAVLMP